MPSVIPAVAGGFGDSGSQIAGGVAPAGEAGDRGVAAPESS